MNKIDYKAKYETLLGAGLKLISYLQEEGITLYTDDSPELCEIESVFANAQAASQK